MRQIYFYLSFKGVKDLQEAFENISAKVVELDSYGLNRVDLPWDEVIKPLGYALLSRHNIFSALAAKHATAPSVESSNDCFSALKVFLRQAGSLYDANAHADGVTTPTGDDATAYAAFMGPMSNSGRYPSAPSFTQLFTYWRLVLHIATFTIINVKRFQSQFPRGVGERRALVPRRLVPHNLSKAASSAGASPKGA